jgi:hypothetical protein
MPLNHNDHFVVNAADPASSRRQIIEFKLSEEVLEEILNGNESIRLDLNHAVSPPFSLFTRSHVHFLQTILEPRIFFFFLLFI